VTRPALRRLLAFGMATAFLVASAADGHSSGSGTMTVSIEAVSGYAGHAFVFAKVTDANSSFPAPTGTGHQSPYYARWSRLPFGSATCPWIWAVYVFNRVTNVQVNGLPASAPQPNLGTTTSLCASPSTTPVDEPPLADAAARLDLDLLVALTPPRAVAGIPTLVTARVTSSLTKDLDLYLNMAIEDWSIRSWSVDFGDGSSARVPRRPTNSLDLPHTYSSPGSYDARVVATIDGHAQAARYDRYGSVSLVQQPFTVQIGNSALAIALAQPARTYVVAQGEVRVSPALDGTPNTGSSFRHVETLRGVLTTFSVQLLVTREGMIRIGTSRIGAGSTRLLRWRLDGLSFDAPTGSGSKPGAVQSAATLLRLQWNAPDKFSGTQRQDYVVPMTLFVETRYQDGHISQYAIESSFSVTINFAVQSG
jgi:hypothetical protein